MSAYAFSVSVEAHFLPEQSDLTLGHYGFSYTITIHNVGDVAAQLIARHWEIEDAEGRTQVVDGLGAKRNGELSSRIVFGPTCDSVDRLPGELMRAEDIAEGDYLVIHGMGAYSVATNTRFNGFGELQMATVLSLKL